MTASPRPPSRSEHSVRDCAAAFRLPCAASPSRPEQSLESARLFPPHPVSRNYFRRTAAASHSCAASSLQSCVRNCVAQCLFEKPRAARRPPECLHPDSTRVVLRAPLLPLLKQQTVFFFGRSTLGDVANNVDGPLLFASLLCIRGSRNHRVPTKT